MATSVCSRREWRIQFHREKSQRRAVADRVENLLSLLLLNSYRVPKKAVAKSQRE
jgi:hypothetical protein